MNYYFPYQTIPYINNQKVGLLSSIFKNGINWKSIISNTQKTLNVVNQTLPVIKQMKPVMNNAKTMFKLMNEFKKVDTPKKNNIEKQTNQKQDIKQNITNENISKKSYNNPTFFQ